MKEKGVFYVFMIICDNKKYRRESEYCCILEIVFLEVLSGSILNFFKLVSSCF